MGRKRKLRRAGLLDNQPKVEEKDEPKAESRKKEIAEMKKAKE